uniref:Translin-associated factor X-interacting protein 1 N-terminal domain-containing protein n=1 Tax=Bubo bubo TaxID=30461 RepID=A0A8C0EPJ4_BUBBB
FHSQHSLFHKSQDSRFPPRGRGKISETLEGVFRALSLFSQPYREIFESFIEDFKTYKPLLTAIKNEYEVTLAHQKKTIRALEPLKAMVTTLSEECSRQILALQQKEKDEINMLKQEKQHLLKFIDNMKEENHSLQTQVERLRTSVAEEYTRYLNEHGARKLLLAKLNDLHDEQLDKTRRQVQDVKGEDVVKLTLALKIARQDLTKAQLKMNTIIADYGDVVPRKYFESLEKKYSDLLQEVTRHSCTPRPNWAKCSEVIPGGAERWGCLAEGKTSDELVDVLLEEIGTGLLKQINAFPGWGKGDNVPVYLRHEGEVKNKKLTKKDMVNILKDVWKEKIALEQQTGTRSDLPEFFLSCLQKKHGDAAFQWSYTLHENMRLCRSNHVLSSFYDVLTGKVGEEQYHAQNQLISNLQKELAACDSLHSGSLTSERFSTALREAFPLKRQESIQELVDASRYQLDSTEDLIDYISLFKEDEEGNAEPFVAKLRSQYVREKQEYLSQLKTKLGDLIEVKADDLKTAFCTIDPGIDDRTLDAYIDLAYQGGRERPDQETVPVETALQRLLAGDVRRVGPPPREGGTPGFEGE